ncbi:MAG: carboxypeptidase regulatory-like domain-containing protein [Vicinamibacterales bacterium]
MLKGRVLSLLALALGCAVTAIINTAVTAGQAPGGRQVRDPTGRPPVVKTGTARLSGTVVLAANGQPAVAARVMLNGQDLPGGKSVVTDDQGRFTFRDLPAGRYSVSASKPGYVNVSYGQRRPRMPPTMIPLADGQSASISLELPRAVVITGMVLDERGEPAINVFVRSMRWTMLAGERHFQQNGSANTDDRGIYRIHSLEPGDYIVCARVERFRDGRMSDSQRLRTQIEGMRRSLNNNSGPGAEARRQAMMRTIKQLEARLTDDNEPDTGYAPVCYPGTSHTSTLSINAGEERSAVDLQLQLTEVAQVSGVILMPAAPGQAPAFDTVQLSLTRKDDEIADGDAQFTMPDGTGSFGFMNVPPGNYRLIARTRSMMRRPAFGGRGRGAQDEEPALWAALDVPVAGGDISDITLQMQRGVTVSGRIVFEGSMQPPADLTGIQIGLSPVRPRSSLGQSGAQGSVESNGRFTIPDVLPGEYRLYAGAPGWFMESAQLSGQDVLDQPLEITPARNVSGILFTLSDRATELSGMIVDGKGQPAVDQTILLFAEDEKFWRPGSRRIRAAHVMPDGKYVMPNIPAGDYLLAAFVDAEPGSWMDPSFLEQLVPASVRISLAPGEKKVHDFRIK